MSIVLNPDVVCSVLQDGGVLLDLTTKQYYALNRSALVAWQYLEDGGTLAALASALRQHPGHADDGLDAFAAALLSHGLAEAGDSGLPADVPAPPLPTPWTLPAVTPHGKPLSQVILSPFDPTVPIPE